MDGLIELILFLMWPFIEEKERFWGCFLTGITVGLLSVFLIHGIMGKIFLVVALALGVACGLLWQRTRRKSD